MNVVFNEALAIEQFKKRKADNPREKQVDNASLHAGLPMFYYKFCGEHTETLPECHVSRPKTLCDPCKALRDHGVLSASGSLLL